MAHLDPAAHHRAHGYVPASPLCCVFIRPFRMKAQTTTNFSHLEMSISCPRRGQARRGWLLVGQSWLGGDEAKARSGRGTHPRARATAAGPSVGIGPSGSWKENKKRKRQTRERPYRKNKLSVLQREREKLQWLVSQCGCDRSISLLDRKAFFFWVLLLFGS